MPIVLPSLSGTTIASNKYTGSEETKVQISSWEFIENEQDTVSPQNTLGSDIEGLALDLLICEDREGPDDKATDGDGQDEGQDDEGADGKGTDPDPKEPDAKGSTRGLTTRARRRGPDDEGLDNEGQTTRGLTNHAVQG
ncbi:hypothetical protein BS47DRAFT_1369550 [Hydnum rufescens UP504]|uniref:Uncharacterized protein n=1 Tax=Hydnum rufescens UP504 TaxID=1448309 RepID=A0A9P6ACI9_9AGAM|nr:hypothetical protein BS47DRAFT_1369550 [Hydnum rufescens UP504]